MLVGLFVPMINVGDRIKGCRWTQANRRNALAASVAVSRIRETGPPDDSIFIACRVMRTLLGNDRAIVVTGHLAVTG